MFCKSLDHKQHCLETLKKDVVVKRKMLSFPCHILFDIHAVIILFWHHEWLVARTIVRQKQRHGTQMGIPGEVVKMPLHLVKKLQLFSHMLGM